MTVGGNDTEDWKEQVWASQSWMGHPTDGAAPTNPYPYWYSDNVPVERLMHLYSLVLTYWKCLGWCSLHSNSGPTQCGEQPSHLIWQREQAVLTLIFVFIHSMTETSILFCLFYITNIYLIQLYYSKCSQNDDNKHFGSFVNLAWLKILGMCLIKHHCVIK